jgi:hypothetical protein
MFHKAMPAVTTSTVRSLREKVSPLRPTASSMPPKKRITPSTGTGKSRTRARQFAEMQLVRGMFRRGGNWSQTASELLDTKRWQSHAQMISWEDARHPQIGLNVEYLDPKSEEWQEYWQLYCLQRLAVRDRQKLYESEHASLLIDAPST